MLTHGHKSTFEGRWKMFVQKNQTTITFKALQDRVWTLHAWKQQQVQHVNHAEKNSLSTTIFMSRPIRGQETKQTVGVGSAPHLWTSWRLFDTHRKPSEKRDELTIKLRQFHCESLRSSRQWHSDNKANTLGKQYRPFKAGMEAFMVFFGVCEISVCFGWILQLARLKRFRIHTDKHKPD